MQEHGTAAAGGAGTRVVVDLDDEVIEMVVAPEPVAARIAGAPDRLILMPVGRVLAPGVGWRDGANGQVRARPHVAVGAPPQPARVEGAARGAAVAFALVGEDAAAPERDRDGPAVQRQPATLPIPRGMVNPDCRKRRIHLVRSCNYGFFHQSPAARQKP
jgi:hypothetical protein